MNDLNKPWYSPQGGELQPPQDFKVSRKRRQKEFPHE